VNPQGAGAAVIGFFATGLGGLPSVKLEGARVFLRPPRLRDWRAWMALRDSSRAFLTPWEPRWPQDALTRSAYLRRLRLQILEWRHDEGYGFLIFEREGGALVGGATLSNVRRGVAQSASLGYWVGERFSGRGYMTDAVDTLLGFAFGPLGLHRIEAACLPNNAPSQRLLRRLGFVEEGMARAYLRIDGLWQDHLLFARLAEDRALAPAA
jgi:ribosomal-protein-alanine N-acetyltransferase